MDLKVRLKYTLLHDGHGKIPRSVNVAGIKDLQGASKHRGALSGPSGTVQLMADVSLLLFGRDTGFTKLKNT